MTGRLTHNPPKPEPAEYELSVGLTSGERLSLIRLVRKGHEYRDPTFSIDDANLANAMLRLLGVIP